MSMVDMLERIAQLPCPICGHGIRFYQKWVQIREDGIRIHEKCAKKRGLTYQSAHRGLGKIVERLIIAMRG